MNFFNLWNKSERRWFEPFVSSNVCVSRSRGRNAARDPLPLASFSSPASCPAPSWKESAARIRRKKRQPVDSTYAWRGDRQRYGTRQAMLRGGVSHGYCGGDERLSFAATDERTEQQCAARGREMRFALASRNRRGESVLREILESLEWLKDASKVNLECATTAIYEDRLLKSRVNFLRNILRFLYIFCWLIGVTLK